MSSYTKEVLLLHLAQAEQSLHRAKNNAYSDKFKAEYQEILTKLFYSVKAEVQKSITTATDIQIYDSHKKHLDFIFKSLEFLDSSTLNQIPYEIVECLNYAMEEWLDVSDKFIIVTSLINNVKGFSYDPWIAFDEALHKDIKTRYSHEFPHRLVQINLPRAFARDYIAAVVLYHELGHFIDKKFSIVASITRKTLDNIFTNTFTPEEIDLIKIYFPYLVDYINDVKKTAIPTNSPLFQLTQIHFAEYFCDLFASQYIGSASNYYLTYITNNEKKWNYSHPATSNRVTLVNDYLENKENVIVNLINEALLKITKKKLEKRYADVSSDDFFNLIPTDINNPKELHGLFITAWDIWINKREKLSSQLNNADTLRVYSIINNLVEKSIGNYITINKWNQAYQTIHPGA